MKCRVYHDLKLQHVSVRLFLIKPIGLILILKFSLPTKHMLENQVEITSDIQVSSEAILIFFMLHYDLPTSRLPS
jgi:hypothetical protein